MIEISAEGLTGVSVVDVLLSGFGSGVVELTVLVFVRTPVADGLTIPLIIITLTSLASTEPRLRPPVHGLKVVPPSTENSGFKIEIGRLSTRVTFCAADGPALVTVMV